MEERNSSFDGGLFQLLGWTILAALITIITLGICLPWGVCMIQNYYVKHQIINGRRLKFDGHAIQLFGNWIKWLLLTIITLGIYGFWVRLKMRKWVTKHTHFEDSVENAESVFDGGLLQLIGWSILAILVTTITLGICLPWGVCMIQNYYVKHVNIDGKQLAFDGHAIQLFGNWIKWLLLTIITLGIYGFWVGLKMKKWVCKHTYY